MRRSVMRLVIVSVVMLALALPVVSEAQTKRPFHNGSVWSVAFIRVKAGMDVAYLSYLAGEWKREQEAFKKEGLILSYKVLATEPHSPSDFNLMLMTEYKSLAAMEASQEKADALAQRLFGDDQKQMQGYKERLEIREVLGDRLAREIVLEPKP